jgi:hypothetical protein
MLSHGKVGVAWRGLLPPGSTSPTAEFVTRGCSTARMEQAEARVRAARDALRNHMRKNEDALNLEQLLLGVPIAGKAMVHQAPPLGVLMELFSDHI